MVDDDLANMYWGSIPGRAGELTDLWLRHEDGEAQAADALLRLLHTMKGEAHMLGLPGTGSLLASLEGVVRGSTGGVAPGVGDAFLEAVDVLMARAATHRDDDTTDTKALLARVEELAAAEAATKEVETWTAERSVAPLAEPGSGDVEREELESVQSVLDPLALAAPVHEARRLQREQALLMPALREVRRMLRALLAEIDPTLSPRLLAERIVKTLSYGAEVDRRMADLVTQWSSSDFALQTALEQLEETVRDASLVSVGSLRAHIHRTARTAARAVGKSVDVSVEGDAYVDATVESSLGPALLHLVRNAVDHGIEDTPTRVARGKSSIGTIRVQIHQAPSVVRVVVSDDGGGIDVERLRARVERINPDAAARQADDELIQHIFNPGLSTRDEVTELSGRGVGLDVVARQVQRLAGAVQVHSQAKVGTSFELVLPTMMRADVVVPVESRGVRMALPARAVLGVRRITELSEGPDGPRLRHTVAGDVQLLPIVDLGALYGPAEPPRVGDSVVILVHRSGRCAARVDAYDNPRALSFEHIDDLAFDSVLVRGVSPAPDGGVYYLLDTNVLFDALRGGPMTMSGAAPFTLERVVPHVLVVEDAPVARELLLGILRSFGLRVSDAPDGREGLEQAKRDRPDIILTDIEMPFLGGLDMVAELRADPQLADTPVVVLTTRDDSEVKRRAAELRVDGFLSKQRFVEADLRKVIDGCLRR